MTISASLLRLIADGKPRSMDEMERESGLSHRQVERFVQSMRKGGDLCLAPRQYVLTEKGIARAGRTAAKEKRIAKEKAELAARIAARAAAKLKPIGRPPLPPAEQQAAKEANALSRRRKHAADRLAKLALKAAERDAAEKKKQAELDAELAFMHRIVEASTETDAVIAETVRMQPALHAVWGAPA